MPRPVPQGRDRLGILGGPVGANAALTGAHANHAIGLNDFMLECRILTGTDRGSSSGYSTIVRSDNANLILRLVDAGANKDKLYFQFNGTNVYSSVTTIAGRMAHLLAFGDRDGSIYFYIDGAAAGSADISAQVAYNSAGTAHEFAGRPNATWGRCDIGAMDRMFVFNGALPDATARAAIAAERFANPDAESPTLAARANYATERRVDITLIDVVYGATTVPNLGTGAATFTIGGGLTIQAVRTRAEKTPWWIPRRTFYSLKSGYTAATAATDFGFAVQPVIMRAIVGSRSAISPVNNYFGPGLWKALADQVALGHYSSTPANYYVSSGGVLRTSNMESVHLIGGDFWIVADGTTWYVIANGQRVATPTALAAPVDLTGDIKAVLKYAAGDECKVCRLTAWNPAAVPGTLEAEIRACVCNPELDPPSLTNKRVDFPLRSDLLAAGGSTVPNQGLGGGTMTLSAARSTSCETFLTGYDP